MTADEIKELRRKLGLTQTAFAMRVGVTVDSLRRYEHGLRSPAPRVAMVLRGLAAAEKEQAA